MTKRSEVSQKEAEYNKVTKSSPCIAPLRSETLGTKVPNNVQQAFIKSAHELDLTKSKLLYKLVLQFLKEKGKYKNILIGNRIKKLQQKLDEVCLQKRKIKEEIKDLKRR